MRLEDAIYHAVHDYEGGVDVLAKRMGLAQSTLQNMANPRLTSHPWSLKKFRELRDFSGDLRPVHALCEESGGVFVPTTRYADAALPELSAAVVVLAQELGDVAREVTTAAADGRIVPREAQRIHQQLFELIEAAAAMARRVDVDAQPVPLKVAK